MPSVEMPLMDRMISPTLILALTALPSSVSCNGAHTQTKKKKSVHQTFASVKGEYSPNIS